MLRAGLFGFCGAALASRCLRAVTVTGGKWLGPHLMMEHLKAAVGPSYYLQSCVHGYQSTAVKGEAEELSSVGVLVAIIIMVEGVLETKRQLERWV